MNSFIKLLNWYLEAPTLWTLLERFYKKLTSEPKALSVRAPFINPRFDEPFIITTDTASFALFDNAVLEHRIFDEVDWLCEAEFHEIKEVKQGDIALVSVVIDGCYKVIVSKSEIPEDIKQQAAQRVTLGVKVISNQCFVGNAESLPGGERITTMDNIWANSGGFFELENGLYDVDIYLFVAQDDQQVEDDNFIDFRIVFSPRTQEFVAPLEEPRLLF